MGSGRGAEPRRSGLALGLRRDEREPHVTLAGRAEERAGRDEQTLLEQAPRHELRRLVDGEPQEERRVAAGEPVPGGLERGEGGLPLPAIDLAHRVDVLLVRPCGDGCALHELLRRRTERGTEGAECVGYRRRRADEARAVARHGRAFRERVEDDGVRAVRDLERRYRPLAEPQLRVRLVRADEEAVLARAGRKLLVEAER